MGHLRGLLCGKTQAEEYFEFSVYDCKQSSSGFTFICVYIELPHEILVKMEDYMKVHA